MEEDTGGTGPSVSDENFESTGEDEVQAAVEGPPINTGPRFQISYEIIWTSSWIFGMIIILSLILARWTRTWSIFSAKDQAAIMMEKERYQLGFNSTGLWRFCNRTTLDCSWCPPGWIDHDSRCYLALLETRTFVNAQEICKRRYRGNLPIVLNAADQILLTNITNKLDEEYGVNGVWVGLNDMQMEGTFTWVNGMPLTAKASFWKVGNPNNMIPWYDRLGEGQDCVAIVPTRAYKKDDWYYSWDDIICRGKRHFICEIPNLSLDVTNLAASQSQSSTNKTNAKSSVT
ncbi:hypothetical protein fugu_009200 [Takifugu bimaculatus]|uniref:C-type lectin domain-containing protein n=1 Tax=Takifugu bimaculatus TaxID=433685 RepID=A0A4Z2AXZ8_9TELE|nr:hypothetical protein fugu_009200 [Takifugu bimaculatus]